MSEDRKPYKPPIPGFQPLAPVDEPLREIEKPFKYPPSKPFAHTATQPLFPVLSEEEALEHGLRNRAIITATVKSKK